MDHALHVNLAHSRDLLSVIGVQRALPSHASVVHQDRHRPQLCFGAGDHRLDRGGLRNVRRQYLGRVRMRSIVHAYGGAIAEIAAAGGRAIAVRR